MTKYDILSFEEINSIENKIKEIEYPKAKKATTKLIKDIFSNLQEDLNDYMNNYTDNITSITFDRIMNFLLYNKEPKNEKLEKLLGEYGYNISNFRYELYKNNKELIDESITLDFINAVMSKMAKGNMYGDWFKSYDLLVKDRKDLDLKFIEHKIVDTIMKLVIDSPNYTDWYQKIYNSRIESKKKELEELENRVQYLKEKLENL